MNSKTNKLDETVPKLDNSICQKAEKKSSGVVLDKAKPLSIQSEEDFCDCNDESCPGCFYPCDSCSSTKCGHQCRINRGWRYTKWELQGEK